MEPEGSLQCSKQMSTCPYSEPDQSNPIHTSAVHLLCIEERKSITVLLRLTCFTLRSFNSEEVGSKLLRMDGDVLSLRRDDIPKYLSLQMHSFGKVSFNWILTVGFQYADERT
jgi:hypothetical protein